MWAARPGHTHGPPPRQTRSRGEGHARESERRGEDVDMKPTVREYAKGVTVTTDDGDDPGGRSASSPNGSSKSRATKSARWHRPRVTHRRRQPRLMPANCSVVVDAVTRAGESRGSAMSSPPATRQMRPSQRQEQLTRRGSSFSPRRKKIPSAERSPAREQVTRDPWGRSGPCP